MAIDLKPLSRKELVKLQQDVAKALKDAEIRDLREARKAAERAVSEFGFSLDEISGGKLPARKTKTAGAAKYRNPNNPDQTWSGRGRRPGWMVEAINAGVDPATLEI
jgi:DNA-binding protein H-NS